MPVSRHTTEHVTVGGVRRSFVAHYPLPTAWPTGLAVFLHPYEAAAPAWCEQIGAPRFAESHGFLALCPQAFAHPDPAAHDGGALPASLEGDAHKPPAKAYWRSFSGLGYYAKVANDTSMDLDLLEALVHWANERVAIPPARTYVFGCSNGASLAFRAACERPYIFDGLAVYAQEYFDPALGWNVRSLRQPPTADAPAAVLAALRERGRAALGRCAPARTARLWSGLGTLDEHYNTTGRAGWLRYSSQVLGCTTKPGSGTGGVGAATRGRDRHGGGGDRRGDGMGDRSTWRTTATSPSTSAAHSEHATIGGPDGSLCEDMHPCRAAHVASRHCSFAGRPHPGGGEVRAGCFQGAISAAWAFLTARPDVPSGNSPAARETNDADAGAAQSFAPKTGAALAWAKFAHCSKRRCRAENEACEKSPECVATWACEAACFSASMNMVRYNRCFAHKCKPGLHAAAAAARNAYSQIDTCSEKRCEGISVPDRR